MKLVKAAIFAVGAALMLTACSGGGTYDKHAIGRDGNVSGVQNLKAIDWTAFQKGLHQRYGERAGDGQSTGETGYFVERAYQASYGGYLLPEELDEFSLHENDAQVLGTARNRLLSAYDRRARVLAAEQSALTGQF